MREVLYGRQAVRETLRAGRRRPFGLFLAKGMDNAAIVDEVIAMAKAQHVSIQYLSREEITQKTRTENHQGIALQVSDYPYTDVDTIISRAGESPPALILLSDLIQDVHNLGGLARTAEAVGVHGIVLQKRRAAGVTPATVSTSSGATEHLYIAQVTNVARTMDILKQANIWIAGLEDVPEAQTYTTVDMTVPLGIVVGSEGQGMRRLVRERCDWLISIPMQGQVNSLNAAIAGSIALYEALRQRSG